MKISNRERGGTVAAGYVIPRPYPRWLDGDEENIEKELKKILEDDDRREEKRRLAAALYDAFRGGNYDACRKALDEAGRSGEWTERALLRRIETWTEGGKRLAEAETGSEKARQISEEMIVTLAGEAERGAFSDNHYRELTTAVLKQGISFSDKEQEKTVKDTYRQIGKVLSLAEEGNAWAHDGLVDEVHRGNEMAVHLLVQRARVEIAAKDPKSVSFGILATACQDDVLAVINRRMAGMDVLTKMECCTETFTRAYKDLWRYEHKGNFTAWLTGILNNVINDFLAKRKKEPVSLNSKIDGTDMELQDNIADSAPGVEDAVAKGILAEDLRSCLDDLPEEQREAIKLYYLAERELTPEEMSPDKKYKQSGRTYADLAVIMKTDEDRIRKILRVGREKVRKRMIGMGYDGETVDSLFR